MAVGVAAEVKSKLTVLEIVGESVQLKKAGTVYKGLCPFHGEKTPSFVVTPARDTWHCFGCQEGGDIFSFVMKLEGLSFPDALKKLAARAGIEIDEHRAAVLRERQREIDRERRLPDTALTRRDGDDPFHRQGDLGRRVYSDIEFCRASLILQEVLSLRRVG